MTSYHAPVDETAFVLFDVLDIQQHAHLEAFGELTREFVSDVLGQVATFSEKTLHPLNQVGDRHGSTRHPDGSVTTPPGFPDAYRELVAGGWPGAAGPAEFGGGGLPHVLGFAFLEYLWAANPGFGLAVPLNSRRLMELSLKIGVGSSLRYLSKQHGVLGNLLWGRTYQPERLLLAMEDELAAGEAGIYRTIQPGA